MGPRGGRGAPWGHQRVGGTVGLGDTVGRPWGSQKEGGIKGMGDIIGTLWGHGGDTFPPHAVSFPMAVPRPSL